MSEAARVELTILGQTLTVRTEAAPEYIRSLAKYLEDRVATIKRGGVRDFVVRSDNERFESIARIESE